MMRLIEISCLSQSLTVFWLDFLDTKNVFVEISKETNFFFWAVYLKDESWESAGYKTRQDCIQNAIEYIKENFQVL
jgi:hypothetical protein